MNFEHMADSAEPGFGLVSCGIVILLCKSITDARDIADLLCLYLCLNLTLFTCTCSINFCIKFYCNSIFIVLIFFSCANTLLSIFVVVNFK